MKFSVFGLLVIGVVFAATTAWGAIPPDLPTIGMAEGANLAKGIFPSVYTMELNYPKYFREIILPHPLKFKELIRVMPRGNGMYVMQIQSSHLFPAEDIRQNWLQQKTYQVTSGDLIPYYDHVYRVNFTPTEMTLTDVTDQLPADMVPEETSRTIHQEDEPTTMFLDGQSRPWQDKTLEKFETIDLIEFDTKKHQAKLMRTPATRKWTVKPPHGWDHKDAELKPGSKWVKEGDLLQIGNHQVRVEHVVLPEPIPGVGRPVGWVEFGTVDQNGDEAASDE